MHLCSHLDKAHPSFLQVVHKLLFLLTKDKDLHLWLLKFLIFSLTKEFILRITFNLKDSTIILLTMATTGTMVSSSNSREASCLTTVCLHLHLCLKPLCKALYLLKVSHQLVHPLLLLTIMLKRIIPPQIKLMCNNSTIKSLIISSLT